MASGSRFVYVAIIRTTAEQLWRALTDPDAIRRYWYGVTVECAWERGAPWKLRFPDGALADAGEVLDVEPRRRIVLRWHNEWNAELKAEGPSRCTWELESLPDAVRLTITHEHARPESAFIAAIAGAWPYTVSNLKSLLETGEVATTWHPGHDASFTTSIEVATSPHHVFDCLADVAKWWGGPDLEGSTKRLGDEFTITHGDAHYSKQKLIELVPDRKVVWRITEGRLGWLERDQQEWTNTKLVFEIVPRGDTTVLRFKHEGLVPELECYQRCAEGWSTVIGDYLFRLITEGTAHFA